MASRLCPTCGERPRARPGGYCRECTNARARARYRGEKFEHVPASIDAQVKRWGYPLKYRQELDDVIDNVLTASDLARDLDEHDNRVGRWVKARAKETRRRLPYAMASRDGRGYPSQVASWLKRVAAHEIQLAEVADQIDVPYGTIRRWWRLYRTEHGLPPLPRGKHAPERTAPPKERQRHGPFSNQFKRIAASRLREAQAVGDDVEDIARDYGIPARYLYRWAEELRL